MVEDNFIDDAEVPTLFGELRRILSNQTHAVGRENYLATLPLVSGRDAIDFLRTVPTGTGFEELLRLAAEWRAAHPLVGESVNDDDPEAAG